jgi:hypothetical protein
MDKIATKTKILLWGVVGDKEKIDFDLCDFSSDEVGQLDRLVRADGDDQVRVTIEPEQKKLQIGVITASVGLVSLSCRKKGQKIKIRGFKSPDERATALKRMCAADTPILLSIEEIQAGLFVSSATASGEQKKNPTPAGTASPGKDEDHHEIELKFKGLRGCKGLISLVRKDGQWYGGWAIQCGNLSEETDPLEADGKGTRIEALQFAQSAIREWMEDVDDNLSGTADAKRSMRTRLATMSEQLDAQLDPILNAAEAAEPMPEESDGPDQD